MKASVELCINKLSDAAAKSDLKANCEKFVSEFGELRTPDGCVLSGMAFWKGTVLRKIGKLIIFKHKKEDGGEWTNYRGISLLSLPGRAHAMMPRK